MSLPHILTVVIFGGFGLVMLHVGVTQWRQQRRSMAHAIRVDATILHAAVFTSTSADTDSRLGRSNSTTTHRPDVRFRYALHGRTYESDLLHPTSIVRGYASGDAARAELAPFAVGSTVRAWVDPAQPDKGFLVREASSAPAVFVVIGVLLPPLAWWVGRYV